MATSSSFSALTSSPSNVTGRVGRGGSKKGGNVKKWHIGERGGYKKTQGQCMGRGVHVFKAAWVQLQDLPLKSAPNEYCSSSASFVATEVMIREIYLRGQKTFLC